MTCASLGLMAVVVSGRVVADVYRLGSQDTAVLLSQFIAIIFLMEASYPTIDYEVGLAALRGRYDAMSKNTRELTQRWFGHQLVADAKLGVAAFAMSLALLTLGGFSGVRVGQLALLAILALAAVISLFVLLTYRREPESVGRTIR